MSQISNLSFHPKKLGEDERNKAKSNRRKEIIKIAEGNIIEN